MSVSGSPYPSAANPSRIADTKVAAAFSSSPLIKPMRAVAALHAGRVSAVATPPPIAATKSRRRMSAGHLPVAEELEEFDALAQAAPHHFGAFDHFRDQRGDLLPAEVEALVEGFERLEDLGVRQVRVVQRCDLHAALVNQLGMVEVEPAVGERLAVQLGSRVGRRQRHLDRVRVDLGGEGDRLLDRLLGFAGQAEDEGAVDRDAELVAVLRETAGDVDPHPLLDVVQYLLVARLVAD